MDLASSLIQRSCQQQVKSMLMAMVMDTVRNVVRVIYITLPINIICLLIRNRNKNHYISSPIALFVCHSTDKESFGYRVRRTAGQGLE